eukprot:7630038-Lingulodinium_polyedra.AAC.1
MGAATTGTHHQAGTGADSSRDGVAPMDLDGSDSPGEGARAIPQQTGAAAGSHVNGPQPAA